MRPTSGFSIYGLGRHRLEMILTSPKTIDFMSQTPLEAAYGWLLSCRCSAKLGELKFGSKIWQIECNYLQPYRLFNGHNSTDYVDNFKNLKYDTIYYVEEGKGKVTHPLCDILFCTKKDELVLIDVTGGEENTVAKKVNTLSRWIAREQGKIPNATLHGVILAPLCKSTVNVCDDDASTAVAVCGDVARALLGGLQQIL